MNSSSFGICVVHAGMSKRRRAYNLVGDIRHTHMGHNNTQQYLSALLIIHTNKHKSTRTSEVRNIPVIGVSTDLKIRVALHRKCIERDGE